VRYAEKKKTMKYKLFILAFLYNFGWSSAQVEISKDSANGIFLNGIWALDWRFDDKLCALGGDDKVLRIYSTENMDLYKAYSFKEMIRSISWHPSKKNTLAITTWGDNNGILKIENNEFIALSELPYGARAVDWNFNGELLAAADNVGLIKIWNKEGKLLREITKQDKNSYFSINWHPLKNQILVSGDDIRIVDTAGSTLKVINHREEHTGVLAVRWHPSGSFFVSGDYGHRNEGKETLLQFWNPNGTLIRTVYGNKGEIRNLEWDKSGKYLATASDRLRIWDIDGKMLRESDEDDKYWGIDWNDKSDFILTASFSGNIILWTKEAELSQIINKK
jgi:WD40 repeat protein